MRKVGEGLTIWGKGASIVLCKKDTKLYSKNYLFWKYESWFPSEVSKFTTIQNKLKFDIKIINHGSKRCLVIKGIFIHLGYFDELHKYQCYRVWFSPLSWKCSGEHWQINQAGSSFRYSVILYPAGSTGR